jgi:VWFA-related protein
VLLATAIAAGASAADKLPEARTEIVRLDAVINDERGALVRDLGKGDFQIFEDGKPQAISHFWAGGRASQAVASAAETGTPAASEGPAPARDILIIVDDLHINVSGVDQMKRALRRVLDDIVAPEDPVALVTTSGQGPAQTFTLDRQRLHAALETLTPQQHIVTPSRAADMTPAQAEMVLAGDSSAVQLAGRNIIQEPGSVFDNAGPRAAVEGRPGGGGGVGAGAAGTLDDSKQRLAEDEARRQARGILNQALIDSVASLRGLENAIRGLAQLPGRKICLLASDGFLVGAGTSEERRTELQGVVDAATRAGAVVYAIDSRGLFTSASDASAITGTGAAAPSLSLGVARAGEQRLRYSLNTLAEQTGGFVVQDTNDLAGGLRRMLEDNDAYYVLAYTSTNPRRDGRFRKIELRVAGHPDYRIRTRRGYYAPDDKKPAPAAVPAPLQEADMRALLEKMPATTGALRLDADYVELPPAGPQALLRARLDLTGVAWDKAADRRRASVQLVGGAYDANGHLVGTPFNRPWNLDFDAMEQKRALEEGLHYQNTLSLPPGKYQVRLIARDGKGGILGGASDSVEIEDLAQKKLALSSVFVSSSPSGVGTEVAQPGTRRFKRGGGIYFALYVYNPKADDQGKTDVVLQVQLNAADKLVAASKPQPVTFQQKDGVPIPESNGMSLEGLEPGPYQLKVVVVDKLASATVFRKVDFTLE